MSSPDDTPLPSRLAGPQDPVIGLLRCEVCGRTRDCRRSEAMLHVKSHSWPRCCREVMLMVAPGDPASKQPSAPS